jgi:NitT/TauT family transport system substrate-binding protein
MGDNMKKTLVLILMIVSILILGGCQNESTILTIMTPAGSPALSQLYVQEDTERYHVDVINGSDPLLAAFASGSHDIIFAPTNLGAKLYNSGTEYQFAGTVTWGNYYLVAKGQTDFDLQSLTGKTILAFGKNQTSDIILQYILAENDIEVIFTEPYADSTADTLSRFVADNSLIILIAEPSLSVLASRVDNLQIIDLQAEYEKLTGTDSYPQAGVFVKSSLDKTLVGTFLSDLSLSVATVNANISDAADLAVALGYSFTKEVLISAIPNSHLDFVSALDSKVALEAYFSLILQYNGNLIGNQLPDNGFYYIP